MGVPARQEVASAEDGRDGRDGHPTPLTSAAES